MAIIKIGKIKVTPEKAIAYAVNDKVDFRKKDDVQDSINYVLRDKAEGKLVYKTISTALYCSIDNAAKEWESVRDRFGKNDKILMFHVKQNFGVEVDPVIANEIGCKLAEELFGDFQCIVSTHTNTQYTHNHIVFNAVSFKTGNKYYDTLKSYKGMREVSDRLCEEYGLPVLEGTKNYKLVKYVGDDGKVHYYEPTERKNNVRDGEYANANDYRNTQAYNADELYRKTNREVIKGDIDKLLPTIHSYDELLEKLQGIGYTIRDKKVNGDWLAHVSFKAPMQEKFTRDYKIGEEYTRERLTEFIENNKEQVHNIPVGQEVNVPIQNSVVYQYGNIAIDELDEEYRKKKLFNGKGYETIHRGEVERLIIIDTKKLNSEIDKEYWQSLKFAKEKREPLLKNKRNQYLLDCINANLRTLQFVENKNVQSFQQINSIVSVLYDKRDMAQTELDKIRGMLKKLNENIVLVEKAKELREYINIQQANPDYKKYEIESDLSLLNSYETILTKRKLSDPEQQTKFAAMYEGYNKTFQSLSNSLKVINKQIKEYDDCVYTISRVDRDSRKQYTEEINSYYEMEKEYKKQGNKNKSNQNHDR